jgi:histidyl-tRNA synthetase
VGESGPGADSELIALLIDSLRAFGLTAEDFVVRLSSRNAWEDFFAQRGGKTENAYAFYQIIDKLEREDPNESKSKLAAINISFDDVTAFIKEGRATAQLEAIINNLSARGLADFVKIDYAVIRGLAYYTGVVFEAFDKKGEFRAIAGGGRYDNLIKLISGGKVDLPALGFGMGDVVLAELLKQRGKLPVFTSGVEYFCMIEDEELRPASLDLIQSLREKGFSVEYSLASQKPDKQFKRALELKAKFTVRLERDPAGDLVIKMKDLATREEKIISVP